MAGVYKLCRSSAIPLDTLCRTCSNASAVDKLLHNLKGGAYEGTKKTSKKFMAD
jgi:hypothetical protein